LEPVYIFNKKQFMDELEEKLKNVTHVAVMPARSEIYGIGEGHSFDGFTMPIIGLTLNTVAAMSHMITDMLRPTNGQFEPYCADEDFIQAAQKRLDTERKAAENRQAAEQARNTELASIAGKLASPYVDAGHQLEAALPLIMEAIEQHENR
jgi:hypothetical protein